MFICVYCKVAESSNVKVTQISFFFLALKRKMRIPNPRKPKTKSRMRTRGKRWCTNLLNCISLSTYNMTCSINSYYTNFVVRSFINCFSAGAAFCYFSLAKARRLYSSREDVLSGKGFITISTYSFLTESSFYYVILVNTGRFYSSRGDPLSRKG